MFNRFIAILLLECTLLAPIAQAKDHDDLKSFEQGEVKTGTINSVDIEEHQIVIDNKVIEIADDIKITSSKDMPHNLLDLNSGQQIKYWVHPQDKKSEPNMPVLPSLVTTKIHIISGLNEYVPH